MFELKKDYYQYVIGGVAGDNNNHDNYDNDDGLKDVISNSLFVGALLLNPAKTMKNVMLKYCDCLAQKDQDDCWEKATLDIKSNLKNILPKNRRCR